MILSSTDGVPKLSSKFLSTKSSFLNLQLKVVIEMLAYSSESIRCRYFEHLKIDTVTPRYLLLVKTSSVTGLLFI